jgi:hypothetical protein
VNVKRHVAGAELFDEEMAKEVVVARQIAHVHDFRDAPCERPRAGRDRHRDGAVGDCPRGQERSRWEGGVDGSSAGGGEGER